MLRRAMKFRTRHQPYMVRANYRHEMRSALTYPLASALAEGSFTGEFLRTVLAETAAAAA